MSGMSADPSNKKHIEDITLLLQQAKAGQRESEDRLMRLIYADLKMIARQQRKNIHSNTINTTGLVHEAWMKLHKNGLDFHNKSHFMAVATLAIKHLLLNEAKRKQAQKNQHQGMVSVSSQIQDPQLAEANNSDWLLELDEALTQLSQYNPRLTEVFQMRFFSGFSNKEIAEYLDVNERTVQRDWLKARLMLSANIK